MIQLILKAEQRRIVSDAFLILMLVMTPILALLLRLYWPGLQQAYPDWHLAQYQPALSLMIALLTPMMLGLVLGFNLLTDREQGMLTVVRTTPAGLMNYLAVRSLGYLVVSTVLTPLVHQLLGFVELSLWQLVFMTIFAQSLLPFTALILLNFAHNLVEGFAVMKGTGFLITVPVILAMFVPAPWYWLAAPLPTWWTLWGYMELAQGAPWALIWLLLGSLSQGALSVLLWRRLMRQVN